MRFTKRSTTSLLLAIAATSSTTVLAASTLLKGGDIISFNTNTNSLEIIRNGCLLITDDKISRITTSSACPLNVRNVQVVNTEGKIISPGFIDTHRHGWQTVLRTLGPNTVLTQYFQRFGEFSLSSKTLTKDDVYISQLTGLYEALNAGVTTTLDHAHHTWSEETSAAGLRASVDSGARVFWCYAIHDLGTSFTVSKQFTDLTKLVTENVGGWKSSNTQIGMAYDNVATFPQAEVERAWDLATRLDLAAVTIHFLGGNYADFTKNDPTTLSKYGLLSNTSFPIVFSHATAVTPTDRQLLREANHYISITPESEMHYGHTHPNSHHLQDQAALGVDTHFTFSTDIITQARIWLQATRLKLFNQLLETWHVPSASPMSTNQAFLLATRNGGLSLRRPDLGVISVGAKADIVVIDGQSPGMLGYVDPVAAVILHASVGDVESVMVNGEWKKKDGKLVDVEGSGLSDWGEVKGRFLSSARRVQRVITEAQFPPLEGDFIPGFPMRKPEVMDVVRGNGNGF